MSGTSFASHRNGGHEPVFPTALNPIHDDREVIEPHHEVGVLNEKDHPRTCGRQLGQTRLGLGLRDRLVGERHVVAHPKILEVADACGDVKRRVGRSRCARDGDVDSSD